MTPQAPSFRVLYYEESEEWVAHLLEMDLVGTGATLEEAEKQLVDAVAAQLSYCLQYGMDPLFPAPKELFERWERAQQESVTRYVQAPKKARGHSKRFSVASFVTPPSRAEANTDGWLAQGCPG